MSIENSYTNTEELIALILGIKLGGIVNHIVSSGGGAKPSCFHLVVNTTLFASQSSC